MRFFSRNLWLILLILVGAGYYFFVYERPCASPIEYRIGSFDTKFGISKEDFLSVLDTASAIWEKPIGRDLFEYNEKGNLAVNLNYDSRQQITQENSVLKADVAKTNQLANSLKAQFLALQDDFKIAEQDYKAAMEQFSAHQSEYNAEVNRWNRTGGAPKDEFDRLNNEKRNLADEYNALESKRLAVNGLADQINQFINRYNLVVQSANATVNKINKTAGTEFEEGTYDPNTNEIDIYQFDGRQKLIRVLAHELGHALGLDHNSNPQSIMYELNQASNEKLSNEDLAALKIKCKAE